jgi:murein hydrolase activator
MIRLRHSLSLAVLVLLPLATAVASDPQQLVEEFQNSRKGLVEAEAQKRKILGAIYTINQRMKKISHDKSHLTDELFQVQDNVKSIAKLIASLEGQIDEQRHHLRKRLRALYKLSGQGYLSVIFSQANIYELDETMRFLKIVTDADYHLIRSYQENVASYKLQKQKLHGQIEHLVAIEHNIKKQEGLLAAEHKAKSKIVSEIDQTKTAKLDRMKTLRSQTQGSPWGDLLQPSIFEQKGQLSPPIDGKVVQDFGLVTDEKYKIRLSHKGWRYAAAKGTPVKVIFGGTVVHAEWMEGYGNTVIVDHGDHYYSIYGHIARLKVASGDKLKKGDVFGEAGSATHQYGEGLYFELRHFSEPENPANWIMKTGNTADGTTVARVTD